MKKLITNFQLMVLIVFCLTFLSYSTSIEVSGNISANNTWDVDTVRVIGEITVDNGVTLSISPGVLVEFQGHYRFNIQGRILAQGISWRFNKVYNNRYHNRLEQYLV